MQAKEEMKIIRNFIREKQKAMLNDPYTKVAAKTIEARICRWIESKHMILVNIRDTSKPLTTYNSDFCSWLWINTGADYKWDLVREWNNILVKKIYELK